MVSLFGLVAFAGIHQQIGEQLKHLVYDQPGCSWPEEYLILRQLHFSQQVGYLVAGKGSALVFGVYVKHHPWGIAAIHIGPVGPGHHIPFAGKQNPVYGQIKALGEDGIENADGDGVAGPAFKQFVQEEVARLGGLSGGQYKLVQIEDDVVQNPDFFQCRQVVVQFQPDVASDGNDLVFKFFGINILIQVAGKQ